MGLAYPAGPEIDRLAATGNPRAYNFPRPMLHEPGEDFSFAGLKTSVRFFLQKNPGLLEDPRHVRDLCASVQAAIVDVLVSKTTRAARYLAVRCVTASGGVACNSALRRDLEAACKEAGLRLKLADRRFSTDNAAMIGILAEQKLLAGAGETASDAEIEPSWAL
jgi:N6-L-threonylcarbamoyladenine synthase